MDQTRKLCEVRLTDVRVSADGVMGAAGAGWSPLARVIQRATVALCAEMCGGAQRVLDMTTEYAKIRVAFGKPIGSSKAARHPRPACWAAAATRKPSPISARW